MGLFGVGRGARTEFVGKGVGTDDCGWKARIERIDQIEVRILDLSPYNLRILLRTRDNRLQHPAIL